MQEKPYYTIQDFIVHWCQLRGGKWKIYSGEVSCSCCTRSKSKVVLFELKTVISTAKYEMLNQKKAKSTVMQLI